MTEAAPPTTAAANPPVQPLDAYFGPADVVRRSATLDLPQPERQLTKVAKLIDVTKCIGCKACQSACVEWNDTHPEIEENVGSYMNPHDLTPEMFTLMRFTEYENPETNNLEWLIRKDGCMHCEDPGCLKACPAPGAIVQYSNGIVDFIHENCIGCGYCVSGCPFDIPRISKVTHTAQKCTLCSDRVAVGQGPACAKACPTQCITFGTKEDMTAHAEERIAELKTRGFENAGLYDPQGVGGTHVMYVLHHADKPEIYANLPADPRISPVVETWKGVTKYIGLAAIGMMAVGATLHGLFARPNEPTPEDAEKAEELVDADDPPREDMMERVYSQSGDRIADRHPVAVRRYGPWTRANHWLTAACLILLLISGLAFFYPSLYFLTALFGGGQTARMLHPWIGVALFLSFLGLFIRMARLNLPAREDATWLANARDVVTGHEERLPELGKYNAGQKFVFWAMAFLIVVLIVSGVMMWERYFDGLVSIPVRRAATITHSIAAVLIICTFILHVYAAIWTRGTISAMTRGTVTGGWAWRHHRKWLRELARLDRAKVDPPGPAE